MPRILIFFGTTDGQTGTIAQFLADELRRQDAQVTVVLAGTTPVDPGAFDGVIVAASIHAGGFQRAVRRWVHRHARALDDVPNAFLSVCLAVLESTPKARQDLERIVNGFATDTGWKAHQVKFVAGALRYTRYGWLKKLVMRRIAGKAGGSTDTTRDHVYTDWADLRRFAGRFLGSLGASDTASASDLAREALTTTRR